MYKKCFFVFILMLFYSCVLPLFETEQKIQMSIFHSHEPKVKIDFVYQGSSLSPNVFFINFYKDKKKIKEFKYINSYDYVISLNRIDTNSYSIVLGSLTYLNDFFPLDTFMLNASNQEVIKISK